MFPFENKLHEIFKKIFVPESVKNSAILIKSKICDYVVIITILKTGKV